MGCRRVMVASTLNISVTIVGKVGSSLLEMGVQQPGSSSGLMISDVTQNIDTYLWEVLGLCIVLAVVALCFFFPGKYLRDAFDPRTKD